VGGWARAHPAVSLTQVQLARAHLRGLVPALPLLRWHGGARALQQLLVAGGAQALGGLKAQQQAGHLQRLLGRRLLRRLLRRPIAAGEALLLFLLVRRGARLARLVSLAVCAGSRASRGQRVASLRGGAEGVQHGAEGGEAGASTGSRIGVIQLAAGRGSAVRGCNKVKAPRSRRAAHPISSSLYSRASASKASSRWRGARALRSRADAAARALARPPGAVGPSSSSSASPLSSMSANASCGVHARALTSEPSGNGKRSHAPGQCPDCRCRCRPYSLLLASRLAAPPRPAQRE
jgi:hypothetical protein